MLKKIPGPLYLWYSVIIFGVSASIVKVLADIGSQHLIDGRNPISFCNILFAGNLCAVILLYFIHARTWTRSNIRQLSRKEWLALLAVALLANCLAPSLLFIAIENTMVTSVVLISQLEPPLLLLLAFIVLKDNVRPLSFIGSLMSLIGVLLIVLLQPDAGELMLGKGELYAALAALIYAMSTVIGRLWLKNIPLGIFTVFRSAVGTVIFFIAANYLFGPEHFVDILSPFLWKWMLIYAALIIVSGQLAWDFGIRNSSSVDISISTSFAPIAGVLGAYLILSESPSANHYIGGVVLILGIGLSLFSVLRDKKITTKKISDESHVSPLMDAEGKAGFKGV